MFLSFGWEEHIPLPLVAMPLCFLVCPLGFVSLGGGMQAVPLLYPHQLFVSGLCESTIKTKLLTKWQVDFSLQVKCPKIEVLESS